MFGEFYENNIIKFSSAFLEDTHKNFTFCLYSFRCLWYYASDEKFLAAPQEVLQWKLQTKKKHPFPFILSPIMDLL